ncbi:MAG: hypothetical protein H6670_01800 [Anaerolineaceae bacterium]|nr:hypothetical protein [Anaerolineaceae bacterium]
MKKTKRSIPRKSLIRQYMIFITGVFLRDRYYENPHLVINQCDHMGILCHHYKSMLWWPRWITEYTFAIERNQVVIYADQDRIAIDLTTSEIIQD